ncbi:MAG: hypothetical protein AB7Q45_10735 [Planctomycetaceae bacterium]
MIVDLDKFPKGAARNTRMWCAGCQTDVAGEFSADGQSLRCSSCGGEVSSVKSPSLHPKTREIRDLLERWSTEELLDPDLAARPAPPTPPPEMLWAAAAAMSIAPTSAAPAEEVLAKSQAEPESAVRQPSRIGRPKFRLDSEHPPHSGSTVPVPAPHPRRDAEPAPHTRLDSAHTNTPAPHFNMEAAFEGRKLPGSGESLWGQLLAYAGIGLLTVGTGMVVWGYFGGPDNYTPTGWLLATAGQMLLFLGVVTLVSGGMEQTTHEVSRRIQMLGDQMVRIERHTQEQVLKGPHFATGDESGSRRRTTADTSQYGTAES